MAEAYPPDCGSAALDRRSSIQSADETDDIEQAKNHRRDGHGQAASDDGLRTEHLEVV